MPASPESLLSQDNSEATVIDVKEQKGNGGDSRRKVDYLKTVEGSLEIAGDIKDQENRNKVLSEKVQSRKRKARDMDDNNIRGMITRKMAKK